MLIGCFTAVLCDGATYSCSSFSDSASNVYVLFSAQNKEQESATVMDSVVKFTLSLQNEVS